MLSSEFLSRDDALARVRECIRASDSSTRYRAHARKQMLARGVVSADVRRVLKSGFLIEDPVWEDRYRTWTCAVQGRDSDGKLLTVVIGLPKSGSHLWIVTAYYTD